MKKSELRKKELGFKENKHLFEFFKESVDKKPMGSARVEFNKLGKRTGKLYWDEIRLVYGAEFAKKPFLEIKTQNGFKLIIERNKIMIIPNKQMEDNCYVSGLPDFDTIEFYSEFEWTINIEELAKYKGA